MFTPECATPNPAKAFRLRFVPVNLSNAAGTVVRRLQRWDDSQSWPLRAQLQAAAEYHLTERESPCPNFPI
jgi:hypothetical protein